MSKAGISLDIPGFGLRHISKLLTDYTGTLSCGGRLTEGVRESLNKIAESLEIHVITADTFGLALKQEYGERLGLEHCVVFGNGNNDRLLLKAAKESGGIAIAVDNGEGCATDALLNSHIFIVGAVNALGLLLEPKACKAALRF